MAIIDIDKWQEIFHTLKQNKLRTILTAFGVAWGIFMLVVMLAAGSGLRNAVLSNMGDFSTNSMFIWAQKTTIPYNGFPRNRSYHFDASDLRALEDGIPEIEVITPVVRGGGWRGMNRVVYGLSLGSYEIDGIMPQENKIDPVEITKGRFINEIDILKNRKVTLIGNRVYEELFKNHEDPLDKYIQINGSYFQIIGVFKSKHSGGWGEHQNSRIFLPFTTTQKIYNYADKVDHFSIVVKPWHNVKDVEVKVKTLLARRHDIHPDDKGAFGCNNVGEEFKKINGLFLGIGILIWFVGIGTLLSGIIGVSNIMLIIIRERTREFGIKRALGATPKKIIANVLSESVFLTSIAGTFALAVGIILVELVNFLLESSGGENPALKNPEVDLGIAISALILLIISGLLAGIIPSRHAISIKPIEAIRTE